MVERALPALLKLTAGDEDHIGVLEAGHVAAEVAAVPRGFHLSDNGEDGGSFAFRPCGCRGCDERECDEGGSDLQSWNWPSMTVWHLPPRIARSPSRRQLSRPVRA